MRKMECRQVTSSWGQKVGTLGSTIPVITVPTSLGIIIVIIII